MWEICCAYSLAVFKLQIRQVKALRCMEEFRIVIRVGEFTPNPPAVLRVIDGDQLNDDVCKQCPEDAFVAFQPSFFQVINAYGRMLSSKQMYIGCSWVSTDTKRVQSHQLRFDKVRVSYLNPNPISVLIILIRNCRGHLMQTMQSFPCIYRVDQGTGLLSL